MSAAVLLVLSASAADAWWVQIASREDVATARAAGLGFAESTDGAWYLVEGELSDVRRAGLPYRPASVAPGTFFQPEDVEGEIEQIAATGAAAIVDLGRSASNQPILALRFGEGGRALRVVGGHHGDETSSVVVALDVAWTLVERGVPEDTEVWVVPMLNPDGLRDGTRSNLNGVDLNRNYAHAWDASMSGSGDAPFSEPETAAVRSLARVRDFGGSLELHSGATNIGWVWNWTIDERAADEPLFQAIAEDYATRCDAPSFWTTNGGDWYLTPGEATDWAYAGFGAQGFTLELTGEKSPPQEDVPEYTSWHRTAIQDWLSRPPDRTALVVDASSGEPITAVVSGDGAQAGWTGPDGLYARWTEDEGTELTASAAGYRSAALSELTELERSGILDGTVEPRLLSRGAGPQQVSIAGVRGGQLRLVAPGEADVWIDDDEPGVWTVDPSALAPGAWTAETDIGVSPNAIFVGEIDDRVAITSVTREREALIIEGTGFGRGSMAWSVASLARNLRPLDILQESPQQLVFRLSTRDDDVLVWSGGAWLAITDVNGDPGFDEDAPTWDPPGLSAEGVDVRGACGCGVGRSAGAGTGILGLVLVAARRRRAPT